MPAFFDTNILVYCIDSTDMAKQGRARSLVAEHASAGEAVICTQVLIAIWDAMVIEAALRSGAATLYTEDLNAGQRYAGLTVVNPFQ